MVLLRNRLLSSLCGPFFGFFRDLHESPPNSDDDDSDREGAGHQLKMIANDVKVMAKDVKELLDQEFGNYTQNSGFKMWVHYIVSVKVGVEIGNGETVQTRMNAIVANKGIITEAMLLKLPELANVHAIELVDCKLRMVPETLHEMRDLRELRLSNNKLTRLRIPPLERESGSHLNLERMHLDCNLISEMESGYLADQSAQSLLVLDLSHNVLQLLPTDFLLGANKIRYLDLSHNQLFKLPDTVFHCRSLQLAYLNNNNLKELPEHIHELVNLRKLFVSCNCLHCLPQTIGACQKLEKLRLVQNNITFLPDSSVHLWKHYGGSLEEVLVEKNPLIQPSITAFQMGGMDQAFRLFAEWLNEKREQEQARHMKAEQNELCLAGQNQLLREQGEDVEIMQPKLRSSIFSLSSHVEPEDAMIDSAAEAAAADADMQRAKQRKSYYYSHLPNENLEFRIAEIRSAESSILVLKRSLWFAEQKRLAKRLGDDTTMGEEMSKFADPNFTLEDFKGTVQVTDVDLYFILLVYTTKPLYNSCYALFDKFETPAGADATSEPYLSRNNFNQMCTRMPIKLPPKIIDKMWELLAWRNHQKCNAVDFVAAWRLHDVEDRDLWIARMCNVLRLDYYDMDVDEMRNRLQAKGAGDASSRLDFDQAQLLEPTLVPLVEGERRREVVSHQLGMQEPALVQSPALIGSGKVRHQANFSPRMRRDGALVKDDSDAEEDDHRSITSSQLSEENETTDSDFDAQECFDNISRCAQQQRQAAPELVSTKLEVRSDADLRRLMTLPVKEILAQPEKFVQGAHQQNQRPVIRTKAPRRLSSKERKDAADTFRVRKALREAYRNMPHDDFVKLINFVQRALRSMKSYSAESRVTYWHSQDPAFRYTMGGERNTTNPYTKQLLLEMGFVNINDYWVWPEKHLNVAGAKGCWGDKFVPSDCPGKDTKRLEEMVKLLRRCKLSITKDGQRFSGHIRG